MSDPFAMFRLLEIIVILGLLHGVYIYIHVYVPLESNTADYTAV